MTAMLTHDFLDHFASHGTGNTNCLQLTRARKRGIQFTMESRSQSGKSKGTSRVTLVPEELIPLLYNS